MIKKVKLAVIGGGPGGYVAAIRAAQLGAEVTLIEKDKMGGTCLNVGCIPTKALLQSAKTLEKVKSAENYGISLDIKSIDWSKIQSKKNAIVNQLVSGVTGLMKANNIVVIHALARFKTANRLLVTKADGSSQEMAFDKIIIASGSVPSTPPIPGLKDNPICIDSTGALSLKEIPKRMVVIGGGVIGVEMASVYHTFGAELTIIEAMPNILPFMDGELATALKKSLEKRGIKILTGAKVKAVGKSYVEVESGGKTTNYEADIVLTAVGRRAETAALGLDVIKLAHDNGRITVDKYMRTNIPGVYAIGDCLGQIMLAHLASAQGELAAEHAMGHKGALNEATNPSCVYTNPEFAGVGITEEEAKAKKLDYVVGKFPMTANGKALIENGGEGIIKVIAGKEYGEILGVHILGPRATDIIAQSALAIGLEATTEDFIAAIHAHPTLAEAVREAVMAVNNSAIHIPKK